WVVELVREHEHGTPRAAKDLRELLVPGHDSRSRIDDEEDEVRLLDRLARLSRDLAAERPRVSPVDPARVDEPKLDSRPLAEQLLAVASHAGRLVDDGGARRREAIDERRLADVRVAHDRHGASELVVHVTPGESRRAAALVGAPRRATPRARGSFARSRATPRGSPFRRGEDRRSSTAGPTRAIRARSSRAATAGFRGSQRESRERPR